MATAVTLKEADGSEIYPVTDISLVNNGIHADDIVPATQVPPITTGLIQDNAVTDAKIDWSTVKYSAGDSITIGIDALDGSHQFIAGGFVTSGGAEVAFNIPLPKSAVGTTPSLTGKCWARHVGGGYFINNEEISNYRLTITPLANNSIGVAIRKNDGTAFGITNNTPVVVCGIFTITFS